MALPIVSLLSLKPQFGHSSFCHNGIVVDIRELNNLPCPCNSTFRMLPHVSSPSMKSYNSVLASAFGTGTRVHRVLSSPPVRWQIGTATLLGQTSNLFSVRPCQVKSEDSEGTLSGESILLDEQSLMRDLQIAIEEENYAQAAKIRDSLRLLHEDSKASVLAANARFYNSFRKGDLAAMQALWAKGENVCVVHPGLTGISGYDLVMGSWEIVWADYEFPLQIELKDIQVHVRGDMGYVTCVELVKTKGRSWGKQFAINVFERIDGQWFICIHHASHVDL
ncbi:hypothetical protein AAG906_036493 [Vitis piasezkii]